jgi:AraC-like DNA-binding protein
MEPSSLDFSRRQFKSPHNPDRAWLAWFREEWGQHLYKLDVEPDPDHAFHFEATTRVMAGLTIAQSTRSPMRTTHKGAGGDHISLVVPLRGHVVSICKGETNVLAPGMGALGRHDIPGSIDAPEGTKLLSLRLQRHLIEPLVAGFDVYAAVRNTQAMRFLLSYIHRIGQEEKIESRAVGQTVTTHVHDLVALAFGVTHDAGAFIEDRGKRAGRLAAITLDIQENLADPQLSAITLALRQGLTPRYVHRLFETEGMTFSEYVLRERLTLAHRRLSDPRFDDRSISAIAYGVGFGDLSYFNRTFRRRFGMTPSDARAEGARLRG